MIGISRNDWELADNDLVYLLASPADPGADFSWVKPGKVAWDWWNGIPYIIMDEGWSVGFDDLFHVVPSINLFGSYDKLRVTSSYTLSKSERVFPNIANGVAFPAKFDRRHILNSSLEYTVRDEKDSKHKLTVSFTYQNGNNFLSFQ